MALVLSESFTTGIPSGFATIVNDFGALTATWHAGSQAVDLGKDNGGAGWRIDASPAYPDLRLVLDLEQLVADNGGGVGTGFGAAWRAASQSVAHLLWLVTESTGQSVARYAGQGGSPLAAAIDELVYGRDLPSTSGRHTYEFVCMRAPNGTQRQYQVWMDSVLLYAGLIATIPHADALVPYVFIRDCAYRLHSIQIYNDATYQALPVAVLPLLSNSQAFAPVWPVTGKGLAAPVSLRMVDYGGNGWLYGTAKIKGTPNYPVRRKVRVHRDLDGVVVHEQWSDATTGAWQVTGIDPAQRYTAIEYDYTHVYRAAIADNLSPEPWP